MMDLHSYDSARASYCRAETKEKCGVDSQSISTMGNSCDKECKIICKSEIEKRCINKIASPESQQNIGLLAIGVEDSSNAACNCGSTALTLLEILVIIWLVVCCGYYTYNVVNQLLEKRNKKRSEQKKILYQG